MIRKFEIEGLACHCAAGGRGDKIAYILYPLDMLDQWVESAARKYGVTIAVITGMDWESVFSPWPAKGVPAGSPDFKGESPAFLQTLTRKIVPAVEREMNVADGAVRTLVGVSMSGLFALWQWMVADTFANIASLSGSFWYEGFIEWISSRPIPHKSGKAFFLLGDKESASNVKTFNTVGANTRAIVALLRKNGVNVDFESVPGNHYANPLPRLDAAFTALF